MIFVKCLMGRAILVTFCHCVVKLTVMERNNGFERIVFKNKLG